MKLSKQLENIFTTNSKNITFQEVIDSVNTKSFGFLLLVLSIPAALPVPAPAFASPFGVAMFFIAIRMVRGFEEPWFPEKLLKKTISVEKNQKLVKSISRFIAFFEKFLRPRIHFLFRKTKWFEMFLGWIVLFCSMSMVLPIPLTNTAPAFGVFLISLGLIEEDGIFAILGIIASILGLLLTLAILILMFSVGWRAPGLVEDFVSNLISNFF